MSKQLLPYKKAKLDLTTETINDKLVVYDADAGLTTLKHRFYVFDREDFDKHVSPDAAQLNIVVQVTGVYHCKEQVTNPDHPAPSQVMASWNKVTIVKIQ